MDRETALTQIRKACNSISLELMKINPAISALDDKEAQDEIFRTIFELTKEVETIKKRLAKLERSDESRDL
jgi:vacuolar-type H+-ATPase subunit I/STV1